MAELKNCERCGEIFASSAGVSICPKCHRAEEADFQVVYRFMTKRKNRQATIDEIVGATDVEEDLIVKFIKENRLRTSQFPNLAYDCEKCGRAIQEGRLCQECSSSIQKAIRQHEDMEEWKEKLQQQQEAVQPIYYTMNKKKE